MNVSDIVAEVAERGISFSTCEKILPGAWPILSEAMQKFTEETRTKQQVDSYTENPTKEGNKLYLARSLSQDRTLSKVHRKDDPWILAAPTLWKIAEEYFQGEPARLYYHDLWNTIHLPYKRARQESQIWHVDNEAAKMQRALFKVFIYFSDVLEEGGGPFEVKTKDGAITAYGPAGTMFFVDTGYFVHRGGYCINKPRLLSVWVFHNHAAIRSKSRCQLVPALRAQLGEATEMVYTTEDFDVDKQQLLAQGAKTIAPGRTYGDYPDDHVRS